MAVKFNGNIDLEKKEIQNFVFHKLSGAPSEPEEGQHYYNKIDKQDYLYNGTEWVSLGGKGSIDITGEQIVALINECPSIIDNDNLSIEINDAISKKHSHSNKTVLDATTSSFLEEDKTKLNGIATGATKNDTDTNLKNRANHSGTQLANTISDFKETVLGVTLTGISFLTNSAITATDSVLSALGKIQKQITDNLSTLTNHTGNTSNPHYVTKSQVGLGNVDNTSDADKPVSTATSTALGNKVDKITGKGLSTEDYTTGEKSKLAGIASGAEVNQNAFSNIKIGATTISADAKLDTLELVAGTGITLTPDATNDKVTITGVNQYVHPSTHSADEIVDGTTNKVYTATEKTKLAGIEAGAEVNNISDTNATDLTDGGDSSLHYHSSDRNRANHTGTQLANTISNFASTVLATVLTGLSTTTNSAITATDSVLGALGKLQAQITANQNTLTSHTGNSSNPHSVTKTQVGLGNVENKSSATIRCEITSSNVTTALGFTPLDASLKGVANGVAELGSDGKVPAAQLPSFVDDVIEGYLKTADGKFYYDSGYTSVITNEGGKIYVDIPSNKTYRWSGSAYSVISDTIALGETSATAYRGDRGKIAYDHSQTSHNFEPANSNIQSHISNITGNPHGVTKSQVGLGSVNNYGVATQAEAETGTSDAKYMTPLKVFQAIAKKILDGDFATNTGLTNGLANKLDKTANAVSASKLVTGRTISLKGDATGSVTFDGQSNVDITVTVVDDSHDHVIANVDGLQAALDGKASTAVATTTSDGLLSSADKVKLDDANTHVSDNVKHITLQERTNWNAKANVVATNIGDGVASEFIITHNLGTEDVTVSLRELATKEIIITDVSVIDSNRIKVMFGSAPTLNQFRVVISGTGIIVSVDGTFVVDGGTF